MEKVNQYKKIVSELIEELGTWIPPETGTEIQVIQDHKQGHYILFEVGWEGKKRIYLPFIHIDIRPDGKVWLQHDGTDLELALKLFERGIPKKQIVLGFHAPHLREYLPDFAIA